MLSNKERVDLLDAVREVEHHIHNVERWFGSTAGVAPALQTSLTPFSVACDATANTFGTAIAVMNGSETPAETGMTHFDPHRIFIASVTETNQIWRIRLANNTGGHANYTDAVAAGYYTEIILSLTANANTPQPVDLMNYRYPVGTKLWAAVAQNSAGAESLTFFIGIHEYKEYAD
jgi:hypothetical protein